MGIVVIGAVFIDIKGYPLGQFIPAGRNVGRTVTVHGGVSRNIAEDIANVDLRPTCVTVVDDTGLGRDVIERLAGRGADTRFIRQVPDGMGTWLAIFDHSGDVVASISRRPDLSPVLDTLARSGDEIFAGADSVAVEIDMDPAILREVFRLARKWRKRVYAVVSNISIAVERRGLIRETDCFVCNRQEAGVFFSEDFEALSPEEMRSVLPDRIRWAQIPRMVVTMGSEGAVWAEADGTSGVCPSVNVDVVDTTGAGDSFFAGVIIGLTYGKSLAEACEIGTRLAASVIVTRDNVCPHFLPQEFGIDPPGMKQGPDGVS